MSQSHNTSPRGDGKTRHILVVDDEPTLRLGFSYALSSAGKVDDACSGRQALEKIKANHYDIIILDLRMPDLDGLGVIEALRLAGNLTPIVLCSAAVTPSAALKAIHHRVVDFLLKPVRPVDLREIVDFVLSPPSTTVSRALVSARRGDIPGAILTLDSGDKDHRSQAWLTLFRALTAPSDVTEEPLGEQVLRSSLSLLSFRSPSPVC